MQSTHCPKCERAEELMGNLAELRRAVEIYCNHLRVTWKYSYTQGHRDASEGERLLAMIDKAMRLPANTNSPTAESD